MSIVVVYFIEMTAVTDPIHLTAVLGSVTPPGRLRRAVGEALLRTQGAETTLIDLAERQTAFADGRPATELHDDTAAVIMALTQADAVLLATPIYRGSLTGALKNLLDHVPVAALQGTPVALVSMGAPITTIWEPNVICATCSRFSAPIRCRRPSTSTGVISPTANPRSAPSMRSTR